MSRFYRHHRKHTTDNDDDDPPMARIDGLLYSASRSQNDKSSVTGESAVKDVAFDVNNLKQTLSALDGYDSSKKVKQFGDKPQKDDDNERIFHPIFDICPKRVSSLNKRKAPLYAMNREQQNQITKILGPGMVLLKGFISSDDQISIVRTCRHLGIGGGGFYQCGKLPVQMMCLGKNWDPESRMYTELRPFDKCKPPAIPEKFHEMVNKAMQDSNEFLRGNIGRSVEGKVVSSMSPDICIVNFYTRSGRLGLYQDQDESEKSSKKGLRPVVSFSIGDSAEFLYGDTQAIDEADKVILESGDVLIDGGESRFIYHGVTSILPDTAPTSLIEATNMCPGRLNLTFRMSKEDDDDARLSHPVFDICPKRVSSVMKLKPPLHVMHREKRNQCKQSMKGQSIKILGPGMVLMKGYISSVDQISLVKTCRDLGIGDGGFYQPGYSCGRKLHLQMMCLGKNWDPDSRMYTELRSYDNSKPPGIPEKFSAMVKKAIQDSNEFIRGKSGSSDEGKVVPFMSPDICIVKFYTRSGRLGLHQDKDESEKSLKKGLPVVSFSIGDSAEFLYGESRAISEADKVILESGDVLIYGGKSRLIYHGVTSIHPETAPRSLIEATNMCPGRLNLSFRMY